MPSIFLGVDASQAEAQHRRYRDATEQSIRTTRELDQESRELDRALDRVRESTGQAVASSRSHEQSIRRSERAIRQQRDEMGRFVTQGLDRADRATERLTESSREYTRQAQRSGRVVRQQRDELGRFVSSGLDPASRSTDRLNRRIRQLVGGISAFLVVRQTLGVLSDFESGLVAVGKTADLSGADLAALGQETRELRRDLRAVELGNLLELEAAAGQLGVKGSENLLRFGSTLAILERTTDVVGEQGARQIARLLEVTGDGVGTVDRFGDVLVRLGNNSAATEAEILFLATQVGQNIGVFGASATEAAALGATYASLGARAELAGSATGRAIRTIDAALREGGDSAAVVASIIGESADTIRDRFGRETVSVFQDFVEGLGRIRKEAGAGGVVSALESLGLGGEELLRILPTIANRSEVLQRSLALARDEAARGGAASAEFANQQRTLSAAFTNLRGDVGDAVLQLQGGTGALTDIVNFGSDTIRVLAGISDESDDIGIGAELMASGLRASAIALGTIAASRAVVALPRIGASIAGIATAAGGLGAVPLAIGGIAAAAVALDPFLERIQDRMQGITDEARRMRASGRDFQVLASEAADLREEMDFAPTIDGSTRAAERFVAAIDTARERLAGASENIEVTPDLLRIVNGRELAERALEGIRERLGEADTSNELAADIDALFDLPTQVRAPINAPTPGALPPRIEEDTDALARQIDELQRLQGVDLRNLDLTPLLPSIDLAFARASDLDEVFARIAERRAPEGGFFEAAARGLGEAFGDGGDTADRIDAISEAVGLLDRRIEDLGRVGTVPLEELGRDLGAIERVLPDVTGRQIQLFDPDQAARDTVEGIRDAFLTRSSDLADLPDLVSRLIGRGGIFRAVGASAADLDTASVTATLRDRLSDAVDAAVEATDFEEPRDRLQREVLRSFDFFGELTGLGFEPARVAAEEGVEPLQQATGALGRVLANLRDELQGTNEDFSGTTSGAQGVRVEFDGLAESIEEIQFRIREARGEVTEFDRVLRELDRAGEIPTFREAFDAGGGGFGGVVNVAATIGQIAALRDLSQEYESLGQAAESASSSDTESFFDRIVAFAERAADRIRGVKEEAEDAAEQLAQQQSRDREFVAAGISRSITGSIGEAILTDDLDDLGQRAGLRLASAFLDGFILDPLADTLTDAFKGLFDGINFSDGIGGVFTSIFGSARGNAFQGGEVIPFASGGLTGSIPGGFFRGPTLFPLGLAGEAGTEAILRTVQGDRLPVAGTDASLPLRRDADGLLKVSAEGEDIARLVMTQFQTGGVIDRGRRREQTNEPLPLSIPIPGVTTSGTQQAQSVDTASVQRGIDGLGLALAGAAESIDRVGGRTFAQPGKTPRQQREERSGPGRWRL